MSDGLLVGRHQPALLLEGAVDRAFAGQGALVFVTGEPGIGKTALLKDAGERAQRRGALVLFGTCWDGDGAPGYWPWVQVLRAAEIHVGEVRWARCTEGSLDAMAPLLRNDGDRRPGGGNDSVFDLHEAVTNSLMACASDSPLVVILDDIHWADPASLRLLDFLVRHAALSPILVVAAYRDAEVSGADPPLGSLLEAITAKALTIPLTGIDVDGVDALLTRLGHQDAPRELVAAVHRRTGGNPFFVEQTAQLWQAGGHATSIPPGVAAAVERRLARLDAATADLLATAALLGNEIDPALLAAVAQLDPEVVDACIRRATEARLVAWHDDRALRFVHDLVRETLSDVLTLDDSRRRHAAIVAAGAALSEGRRAHHAYHAVPTIPAAVAVAHLDDAATTAENRAAWEESTGHLLRAIELTPTDDLAAHADLLLRVGTLQARGGLLDDARLTYDQLAITARELDDPVRFARAALGTHDLGHAIDDDSKEPEAAIDAAYAALVVHTGGQPQGPLAARLLAAVARTRSHLMGGDRQFAVDASATAVAVARSCEDPAALAFALLARHDAIWQPGTAAERAALTAEMETAARRAGVQELALQATMLHGVALLEQGDQSGLAEHERFVVEAERSPFPRQRYIAKSRRAAMAMFRGEFDAARQHVDDALAYGRRIGEIDAFGVWGDQIFELTRLRGDTATLQSLITEFEGTGDPHIVALEAMLDLDRGRPDVALRRVDELRVLGDHWPRWAALVWVTFLAELASATREPALIEEARAAVSAHIDDWAMLAGGVLIRGPLRYFAARIDAADGRYDRAIDSYEQAARASTDLGAAPWATLSHLGVAEALLDRGELQDTEAARVLLVDVAADAERIGMAQVLDTCRRHIASIDRDAGTGDSAATNDFRRVGQVWWLSFDGLTIQVPDAKGLHDLHLLLTHAGRYVAAVDLLEPAGGAAVAAAQRLGSDAVLDDQAKGDFRRRLAELDDTIDRALSRHDDERAVAAEAQRDALIDELKRATGLGGRDRRLGDETERARKTVTARIRDTIRKLDRLHPALADHLRGAVTTGASCTYSSDRTHHWRL